MKRLQHYRHRWLQLLPHTQILRALFLNIVFNKGKKNLRILVFCLDLVTMIFQSFFFSKKQKKTKLTNLYVIALFLCSLPSLT